MQVYKMKDNTWKMNCFGHLPDNVRRQKMSLCEEDVCIIYISKTRGHWLARGGRTRCLHSQLPLQSTGQIQLMEKGNGTHQLENPTRSRVAFITADMVSLSNNISDRFFVPRTFRIVVAAIKRVEWLKHDCDETYQYILI